MSPCPKSAVLDAWKIPEKPAFVATMDWNVVDAYAVRPFVKSAVDEAPSVPLKSPEVATNPWSVEDAYAVKP